MKTLHLTLGAGCAAAAIAAPSSAMASTGFVGALKGPAVVDGVRMSAKQVKQIVFDGEPFTAPSLQKMRDRLIPIR